MVRSPPVPRTWLHGSQVVAAVASESGACRSRGETASLSGLVVPFVSSAGAGDDATTAAMQQTTDNKNLMFMEYNPLFGMVAFS
jgi:hypothetical protein